MRRDGGGDRKAGKTGGGAGEGGYIRVSRSLSFSPLVLSPSLLSYACNTQKVSHTANATDVCLRTAIIHDARDSGERERESERGPREIEGRRERPEKKATAEENGRIERRRIDRGTVVPPAVDRYLLGLQPG